MTDIKNALAEVLELLNRDILNILEKHHPTGSLLGKEICGTVADRIAKQVAWRLVRANKKLVATASAHDTSLQDGNTQAEQNTQEEMRALDDVIEEVCSTTSEVDEDTEREVDLLISLAAKLEKIKQDDPKRSTPSTTT